MGTSHSQCSAVAGDSTWQHSPEAAPSQGAEGLWEPPGAGTGHGHSKTCVLMEHLGWAWFGVEPAASLLPVALQAALAHERECPLHAPLVCPGTRLLAAVALPGLTGTGGKYVADVSWYPIFQVPR